MSFLKTNHVGITVDGQTYDSLVDFGLAIENTDYIGEPEMDDDNLVFVPGRSGPLDFTEAVFGQPYFHYRRICIQFGGIRHPEEWDQVISEFRNLFHGKWVRLTFATDPEWYWTGRATIERFSHTRALGTFEFRINYADPYKYRDVTKTVFSTATAKAISCPCARLSVIPVISTDAPITITFEEDTILLSAGTHLNPAIRLKEGTNELTIRGQATVTITYREGSL